MHLVYATMAIIPPNQIAYAFQSHRDDFRGPVSTETRLIASELGVLTVSSDGDPTTEFMRRYTHGWMSLLDVSDDC